MIDPYIEIISSFVIIHSFCVMIYPYIETINSFGDDSLILHYNIVGAVSYSSTFQSQKQQFIIIVYYANQPRFELIITLYSLHDHD